ncbi:hypothetical protein CQY20_00195 [Mycolicibacterium agri]|uniref:Glycerophosphoryl diester phosphodiesterase membrane domain-containing protein n=1 Tax=Mycolicibacterium agri TaxID=36811 RepID=A0A2A7NG85_MYCAG|nr:hypothetical protein CQY20_00195 [Mycolicibacterium agri]GFG54568.1 hypothetical protein MAGR_60090 [Mycolicibacterium agri]
MDRIRRGWALTKQSWSVLQSDRSLVIFPILSSIFATLAAAAIWAPTVVINGLLTGSGVDEGDPAYYIATAATIYVTTFVAIFFNVALSACAVRSMRGEDTSVGDGVSAATRRFGAILGWTLVSGSVGVVLRLIEERAPLLGRIAGWMTGAAWAVASFFVIPIIALEGDGPIRSLKRSTAVVKERWGEGATGAVTISVVAVLLGIVIAVAGTIGVITLMTLEAWPFAIGLIVATVVAVILVSVVSSALSQIFRVAVYQYAATGQAAGTFDAELLERAFDGRVRRG